MNHIKRINNTTFHVTIGERILEAVCPYNNPVVSKLAVQGFLAGNTKFKCRVTDITERLRIEAESTLLMVSKEVGCRGVERYGEGTLHLRHPFGLIHASWSRKSHNWTISTDHDIYVCDPDTVSVRKALVFLLDDTANRGEGCSLAPVVLAALSGFAAGAAAVCLIL